MIRYSLPYPPTVNNLFFNVRHGRVKTDAYRAWLENAGHAINVQGKKRICGPVSLSIGLVRPDKRKRDLSNTIKSVEDLLVSMGVIEDDSLVQKLSVQWVSGDAPCTVIIHEHVEEMAA